MQTKPSQTTSKRRLWSSYHNVSPYPWTSLRKRALVLPPWPQNQNRILQRTTLPFVLPHRTWRAKLYASYFHALPHHYPALLPNSSSRNGPMLRPSACFLLLLEWNIAGRTSFTSRSPARVLHYSPSPWCPPSRPSIAISHLPWTLGSSQPSLLSSGPRTHTAFRLTFTV